MKSRMIKKRQLNWIKKGRKRMFNVNKEKLMIAIANSGYSATELASLCGLSQVTLARIKAGTQKARPQTINKIANALNMKVEDLVEF